MTVKDYPSLEAFLATQLSHHGLEMIEGGVQLLDVPESVSHTARFKRTVPVVFLSSSVILGKPNLTGGGGGVMHEYQSP